MTELTPAQARALIDFHNWLDRKVWQSGVSIREMARLTGLTPSTISRLRAQRRNPSLATALLLVRELER